MSPSAPWMRVEAWHCLQGAAAGVATDTFTSHQLFDGVRRGLDGVEITLERLGSQPHRDHGEDAPEQDVSGDPLPVGAFRSGQSGRNEWREPTGDDRGDLTARGGTAETTVRREQLREE